MVIPIFLLSILHIAFYLRLALSWRKILPNPKTNQNTPFSVIIPVRNEASTIVHLLKDLEVQDHSLEQFEILVVNDFSEDDTATIVEKFAQNSKLNITLLHLQDQEKQGKKYAITKGVEHAQHDIILTTDADCRVKPSWISSYARAFTREVNIMPGPVALEGQGLFSQLQKTEFSGLMGFGAVTLSQSEPSICSGANLGFRKEIFFEVNGYNDNLFIPSGDDEFLLHTITREYPGTARFLKDEQAIVNTSAHTSFSTFFSQRTRWISKWKYNRNPKVRLIAILFFLDCLLISLGIVTTFFGYLPIQLILSLCLFRFASNYLFMKSTSTFLGNRKVFFPLLLLQIFYPLHVLFMGVVSIFGSYTWKGRKY